MTDRPTFDERFDDLAAIAYRVAYRMLGDRHEAENVAQEALARAFVRWTRVRSYDEAWVTRVTTNLTIGWWRRNGRIERDPSEGESSGDVVDHMAERIDLARGLARLSRRQREVLALRYLADLTEAETAQRLGCSIGTVKQHASRGLRSMRGVLDGTTDAAYGPDGGVPIDKPSGAEPC